MGESDSITSFAAIGMVFVSIPAFLSTALVFYFLAALLQRISARLGGKMTLRWAVFWLYMLIISIAPLLGKLLFKTLVMITITALVSLCISLAMSLNELEKRAMKNKNRPFSENEND